MILFTADSLQKSQVETDYQNEWDAAKAADFVPGFFNFDALTRGYEGEVLRFLPRDGQNESVILRSWMMSVDNYAKLELVLRERNFSLFSTAKDYETAHHFPNFYPLLQEFTPRSISVAREEFEREGDLDFAPIRAALESFGEAPLVIKDWVKSQKHHWREACFIPRAGDFASAERVVRRFLELQDEMLVGGVVLREFVELKSVGTHPKSGLPLTAEWRVFVFDGEAFFVAPYWDGADYSGLQPDFDFIRERARSIPNRFFSLDIAQTTRGEWTIIEIGDGQVSGLPSLELAPAFFVALRRVAPTI